jgi:hypothetical protein
MRCRNQNTVRQYKRTNDASRVFLFGRPRLSPTETYRYYSLPFCHQHSTEEEEKKIAAEENANLDSIFSGEKRLGGLQYEQSFGESLFGDHLETSPYQISFLESVDWRLLCKTTLDKNQLEKFKEAIHNDYFFEMFVEDLPVWGYMGDTMDEYFLSGGVKGSKTYLFPHLHFYLGYNGDQIVAVKITTDVRERYSVCSLQKC